MSMDVDTVAADINQLVSKKRMNMGDGVNIASGKITAITDKKELDLISGSGGLESWGQVWAKAWFAIGF
ncbi:MAG: hypothetical protein ACD_21C00105G0005 [uncultured bacterium]|nr:MAG: hypothetical protein ACD_21C00105G0005 [uncultured bacterium]